MKSLAERDTFLPQRRGVLAKLQLAGANSAAELVRLMEAPSPPEAAEYIPAAAHFRGGAPLLNFRIDINGHKLLRTKTLEALHRAALQPIEAESGYVPAAQTMALALRAGPGGADRGDGLLALVAALWPARGGAGVEAQQAVMWKLHRAGVRSVAELAALIAAPAPRGCRLPTAALLRGRACALNHELDRRGAALFRGETLHALAEHCAAELGARAAARAQLEREEAAARAAGTHKLSDAERRAKRAREAAEAKARTRDSLLQALAPLDE